MFLRSIGAMHAEKSKPRDWKINKLNKNNSVVSVRPHWNKSYHNRLILKNSRSINNKEGLALSIGPYSIRFSFSMMTIINNKKGPLNNRYRL